jgi:uncharacterized protein
LSQLYNAPLPIIMMVLRFIMSIAIFVLIEWMAWDTFSSWQQGLSPNYKNGVKYAYIALTVVLFGFLFLFPILRGITEPRMFRTILSLIVMAVFLGKLAMVAIALPDYLKRGVSWLISLFYTDTPPLIQKGMTRSDFLRNTALLVGGAFAGLTLYGAVNRYRYRIRNVKVPIAGLPDALKQLKIVQLSDIHSGSFTSTEAVAEGVKMINDLNPDLIFFTGDLVNNEAAEMKDYIAVFKELKAKYGVYSITGNHDYGDYISWPSARAKVENFELLKKTHADMGWKLLLNENLVLNVDGARLGIIGVENIAGKPGFHTYGDLDVAIANLPTDNHANILLSHDPSHWNFVVKNLEQKIDLTLSGHTHGMQFGIEIPGFKWSPVKFIYEQWAGLYTHVDKHVYVNRGFGFLGYPGRLGILPEIAVLQLV